MRLVVQEEWGFIYFIYLFNLYPAHLDKSLLWVANNKLQQINKNNSNIKYQQQHNVVQDGKVN